MRNANARWCCEALTVLLLAVLTACRGPVRDGAHRRPPPHRAGTPERPLATPATLPNRGDVCLIAGNLAATQPAAVLDRARTFRATRILAEVGPASSFFADAADRGIRVQAILDPVVAADDWHRHTDFVKRDVRETAVARADGAAWGCPSAPGFLEYHTERAKALLTAGAEGLHVPDFAMDGYCLSAAGADPAGLDRCYCRWCVRGFQDYLRQLDVDLLAALEITDTEDLDYLTYLLREHLPANGLATPLAELYEEYSRQRLRTFWRHVRRQLDDWAGRRVLLTAGNATGNWEPVAGPFDAGLMIVDGSRTPADIYREVRAAGALDRPQLMLPRAGSDAELARLLGAIVGAGGIVCIPAEPEPAGDLPWAARYARYGHFVREHHDMLVDHRDFATAGPGLDDARHQPPPPLTLAGDDGQVSAFLRRSPRYASEPLLVHLLDWAADPKPFTLGLHPHTLWGSTPITATLLRPGREPLELPRGSRSALALPELRPWGIVVLRPRADIEAGTWSPLPVETRDANSPDRVTLELLHPTGAGSIHYTIDGSAPTADAPAYTGPMTIDLEADLPVRAIAVGPHGPSPETMLVLRQRPLAGVIADRPAPLPEVRLTDLSPHLVEPAGAPVRDRLPDGAPLVIGRREVAGLAVAAATRVHYQLLPYYATFVGTVGVPVDQDAALGVRCRLRTGRRLLWESPVLYNRAARREIPVRCELPADADTLVLEVLPVTGGKATAIWADAGFLLDPVPGTVVAESLPITETYLALPSIVKLECGDLLAGYNLTSDYPQGDRPARWRLAWSGDDGQTWERRTEIPEFYGATLFADGGYVYALGSTGAIGQLVIRRSADRGQTWTEPVDVAHGVIGASPRFTSRPTPVWAARRRLFHTVAVFDRREGRWVDPAPVALSIPRGADLLNGENWTISNRLPFNRAWVDDEVDQASWLPGSMVQGPDGRLVAVSPLQAPPTFRRAALLQVSDDGEMLRFQQRDGLVEMVGGGAGFVLRYDPTSKCYWALTNRVVSEDTPWQRNNLVLACSADLRRWEVAHDVLRHHEDAANVAFQNVDWHFDGEDIVAISQTSYRGARSWQLANMITFHRIADFRRLQPPRPPEPTRKAPREHLVAAWDFEPGNRGVTADKALAGRNGDSIGRVRDARIREGLGIVPRTVGSGFLSPPSPDLNLTGPLTVYARILLPGAPGEPIGIVEKHRAVNPQIRCYGVAAVRVPDRPDAFALLPEVSENRHHDRALNGIDATTSTPLPLNRWVEIAMVVARRANGTLELSCLARIDGQPRWHVVFGPVAEPRIQRVYDGPVPLVIGNHRELMPSAEALLVDEVRVYNRDLTAFELSDIRPGELSAE